MGNENEEENVQNRTANNFQLISLSDQNNEYYQDIHQFPQFTEIPNVERTIKRELFITNKRGRKTKEVKDHESGNNFSHDKYSLDNIRLKINLHYFSFIRGYANCILKKFGFNEEFKKIDHKNKRSLNKSEFSLLKKALIGELLSKDISPKYKKEDKNGNIILYNKVKSNPIIENIFSETYITLFKNIYFKNIKYINLNDYGIDMVLRLNEEVETFDDFINKMIIDKNKGNIDEFKDEFYKNRILKCVNKCFLNEVTI